MQVKVCANNIEFSTALQRYAEARIWLAVQHVASRLSWVGVRLEGRAMRDGLPRITCQIDAWLRGRGVITVRHTDANAYAAIDRAVVRLRRAIGRDVGSASRLERLFGDGSQQERTVHGIAVVPQDSGPWREAWQWLRWRYGVEHLHTIRLTGVEWDGLSSPREGNQAAERLKDRLALSLLGRPELIAVIGHPPTDPAWRQWPRSREDVRCIAERIAAWDLPVHVVGVWIDGPQQIQQLTSHLVSPDVQLAPAAPASEQEDELWLAEQVWETEGGRPQSINQPATEQTGRQTPGRNDDNARELPQSAAHQPDDGDEADDPGVTADLPGFRPDPSRLAHA